MEIILQTNTEDCVLKISNVTKDSFKISVLSGEFTGNGSMYHYIPKEIDRFIDEMGVLDAANEGGIAELIDVEDNKLTFSKDKLGQVIVTGRLVPHSFPHQELQFGFITDQTCLAPFAAEMKKARSFAGESTNGD